MKPIPTIAYGLLVIWTGLWRCIQAGAFKPNAFWFCLVLGLANIAAAHLAARGRTAAGRGLAVGAAAVVLAFYLQTFMLKPGEDATYRVSIAIVASIGQLSLLFLPLGKQADAPD